MKERIKELENIIELYYALLCPKWMKLTKQKASQELLTLKLNNAGKI